MDDSYYRRLIKTVQNNDRNLFNEVDSDEYFDDFSKLWEILFEENPEISPDTFFEAADLCLNSFYGVSQDHAVVWNSVTKKVIDAIGRPDNYDEFREAFIGFSNILSEYDDPQYADKFSEMMHSAISKGDADLIHAIIDLAFCEELWVNDEEYPEWSVWFAIFLDKDFSEVPVSYKTEETINELRNIFKDGDISSRIDSLASALQL